MLTEWYVAIVCACQLPECLVTQMIFLRKWRGFSDEFVHSNCLVALTITCGTDGVVCQNELHIRVDNVAVYAFRVVLLVLGLLQYHTEGQSAD